MTPIAFDGCFGWLHQVANRATASECGVVMCGAIGFEKQIFHRSWRFLAENLAADGHPTLRFDYPGCGDSRGLDSDPDALGDWMASIEQAIAWLRANTGVRRIVLCGIHLGGLLAASTAARLGAVDGLVLLAPVLSGRLYARSLALSAKIDGAATTPGLVEAYGLRLHETTLQALRPLDLARLPRMPAPKILILAPAGAAGTEAAASALEAGGSAVTLRDMPDYLELTRPAHESAVPVASFASIRTWLREQEPPRQATALPPAPRPIPVAELRLADAIEHPLLLGEEGARVFGMLCQPTGATHEQKATHSGTRPAVLICNTGANPHYGYGRLAVALARELARDGVASLRLDPAGIGDSDGASTVSLPDMYTDRGDDLRAATDLLERRGYGRVVVFGICTGAYHAFHAAQHDDRIAGVVLVNQIVYRWRTNPILFRAEVIARALIGRLRGDKSLDAEQELLRLRIAPPNPTKNKLRRTVLRAGVVAERMVLRPFGLHTVLTLPERSLKDLAARGVRMLAVAGQDDYGRSLLQVQFGPDFSGSHAVPGLCVRIEPEFDHPVGQSGARARLIALVRSFVAEFAPAAAFPAAEPTLRPATHARG